MITDTLIFTINGVTLTIVGGIAKYVISIERRISKIEGYLFNGE